jgi:hypothetical protein
MINYVLKFKEVLFVALFMAACGLDDVPFLGQKGESSSDEASTTTIGSDSGEDASISFPEGTLPLGVELGLQIGNDIRSDEFIGSLKISGEIDVVGPSINLASNKKLSADVIGKLELSIPFDEPAGLLLASAKERIVIIYHITDEDDVPYFGYIVASKLTFAGDKIKFNPVGLGNYQAAVFPELVTKEKSVKTEVVVATKEEAEEAATPIPTATPTPSPTPAPTVAGNTAPVLAAIGNISHGWPTPLTFTISATDADAGATLTYSCSSCPAGASLDPATGGFSWTTAVGDIGVYTPTFSVSDGVATDSEAITITVTPPSVIAGSVAYYRADTYNGSNFPTQTCSNTQWNDLSGNGLHATTEGFTSCSTGTNGWVGDGTTIPYHLGFISGSVTGATAPAAAVLDLTTAVTIAAWVYVPSTHNTNRIVFGKGFHNGSLGGPYMLVLNATGRMVLYMNNGINSSSASSIVVPTNTWTHLVATRSGISLNYYINGVAQGSYTVPATNLSPTGDSIKLGVANANTANFHGKMAVAMIYGSALSQAQILQNCRADVAKFSGATCP